ncbi:MAG: formylglycine-generating enzyme family protein [Planctomycetes bacterium]|nr:formylglycine-generating enzyme family protein [Planctomycetota bacterium]
MPSATRTAPASAVTSLTKPPRPAVAATAAAAPPVIAAVPPIEDRDVVIVAPKAAPKRAERSDEHGRFVDVAVLGTRQRFRYCPPGRFLMGSPDNESRRGSDEDIHQVTLTQGFWIADSECTQALWNAVMGYDPSSTQDLTHPVEQVSWDLVQQFLTKLAPLAPGLAPRLPSETEWEYACRAGSAAPFAADIETCGWYDRTSGRTSRPVKLLAPNAWGLFDCHGNVSEWCQDSYGDYPKPVVVDPPLRTGGAPVIRGGSFRDHAEDCRSAHRDHARARAQNDHLGFRIASSVVPGP